MWGVPLTGEENKVIRLAMSGEGVDQPSCMRKRERVCVSVCVGGEEGVCYLYCSVI